MKRIGSYLIILLTSALFLQSCENNLVFEKEELLENGEWTYGNILTFTPEIADTSVNYEVELTAKISKLYPFQNIYLSVEKSLLDEAVSTDTINLPLINRKGEWLGKCSSNDCTFSFPLFEKLKFKKAGQHSFKLAQFTRNESLKGIQKIGIRINTIPIIE